MKKLIPIAAAFALLLDFSCKKETTCYANIIVVDANIQAPIIGATVKLDCGTCSNPSTSNLQTDQTTTDASGRASFTFKYEAVLDITVTSSQGPATGVVKLEAGKTVEKTVSVP
jgi:hypothetical protein